MLSKAALLAHREYNKLHKEEIYAKNRLYRIKNREKLRKESRKNHRIRREEERNYRKQKRKNNLNSWKKIIPHKTRCEICGRVIYYKALYKMNSIHFDHRHEGKEPIKCNPSSWLKMHPRNKVNEALWIESDFGILCHMCNYRLPTRGRKDWVRRMNKYVSRTGD